MPERDEILVVGGGLAGLVIARDLAIADRRVILLEAGDRLGGRIAATTLGGVPIDVGVSAFEPGEAMSRLATELDLEIVAPADEGSWLIGADGRARALPSVHLLGIPAAPMVREVIDVIGPRAALRAQLDAVIPIVRTARTRSLGELVRRRMGRAVVDRLVAPVVRATHAAQPDEIPVGTAARRLPAALARSGTLAAAIAFLRSTPGPDVVSLAGGLHRLVTELEARATRVGVEIRTNARVATVSATGVRLENGEELSATAVVVAAGDAVEHDQTSVFAVIDAAALDGRPRGTRAFVAAEAAGISARAFEHTSARWSWIAQRLPEHRHLVRLEYGERPADPEATAVSDLRAITGAASLRLVDVAVHSATATAPPASPPEGVVTVGPAAGRTELADLVEHARSVGADLISGAVDG